MIVGKSQPRIINFLNNVEGMKKKTFLTAVATLAASMAIDASAALQGSLMEQFSAKAGYAAQEELPNATINPFVLERPDSSGSQTVAYHYSHSSHASHASSRY